MDPEEPSGFWDYFYTTSQNPAIENSHVSYTTVLLPILYGAMFLVGVLGNLALMGALHFKRSNGRLIDIFIFNLAASDFIFLVTLPLWVDKEASVGQWRTGSFLCKGSSYVISVNMHSNVFLLTCMSVDRYLAIIFPATSRKFRRRECAYKVCVSIWIISCLLGLPILLSRELTFIDGKPYCAEKKASFIKLTWSLVALIFTFFAPLVSILTCYCCIMRKLFVHYQQSGKHNKKLRKSMKIILIVVAAFVFSWVPFNTFKLLSIILGLHQKQEQEPNFTSHFLKLAIKVSGPLAFANSCVNPFIYYIFDSYIRRAIVRCFCSCLKNYNFGSSTETSDTHFSHVFSNYVHSEDLVRRRRRSRSL